MLISKVEQMPIAMRQASPKVAYECLRLCLEHNKSLQVIGAAYSPHWEELDGFADAMLFQLNVPTLPTLPSHKVWNMADSDKVGSENVIRTGRLAFDPEKGGKSIFKLILSPLRLEPASCRFFRKYGSHRSLKLFVPDHRGLPNSLKDQPETYSARIIEWLTTPGKEFMGYLWSVFYVKQEKRSTKSSRRNQEKEVQGYQVYLFATTGPRLPTVSLTELFNWFLPINRNLKMTSCKAYARLELGTFISAR